MYELVRIVIEVVSAIACFILLRFMIKPYQLTGESRYLGLPLGFGFLGVTYAFSALAFSGLLNFREIAPLQLFARAFAFAFLAATYYFSKKPANKPRWDITLGLLVVVLATLILFAIIAPQLTYQGYQVVQVYVRVFIIICLTYVSIHTLRSHVEKPDPATILIPFGYIFLGISQYSLLIWAVDTSIFAFFAALTLRLFSLSIFLFVSYRTFYASGKRGYK